MKKLVSSDLFFAVAVILAVVGEIAFAIQMIVSGADELSSAITLIVRAAVVAALFVAYKKKSYNVMKALIGALLMAQLINSLSWLGDSGSVILNCCNLAYVLLSVIMFVIHIAIATGKVKESAVTAVGVIAVFLIVINTVTDAYYMTGGTRIVANVLDILGFAGMMCSIIAVENRLEKK